MEIYFSVQFSGVKIADSLSGLAHLFYNSTQSGWSTSIGLLCSQGENPELDTESFEAKLAFDHCKKDILVALSARCISCYKIPLVRYWKPS